MKNLLLKILLIISIVFVFSMPAFSDGYVNRDVYKVEDLTSFRLLTKQFQADFDQKRGTKEAEDAYLDILYYYYDFLVKQSENINVCRVFSYADDNFIKYQYSFYMFGLLITCDDGGNFFDISHKYLNENFAPYLSKEWQELLAFKVYFDKIVFFDGRYAVPKSEVEQIVKFYSNFCKKYPEFSKEYEIYERLEFFKNSLKHYPQLY